MSINFLQLETFVSVAKYGSFTKAAENSFISVSALQQQVRALEKNLGFRLFSRTSRGVALTEEGACMLEAAAGSLRSMQAAVKKCEALQLNKNGRLRIGIHTESPGGLTIKTAAYIKRNGINLPFVLIPCRQIMELEELAEGNFELKEYINMPDIAAGKFAFSKICDQPYRCLVCAESPLAGKASIGREDMLGKRVATHHVKICPQLYRWSMEEPAFALENIPMRIDRVMEFCLEGGVYILMDSSAHLFTPLIPIPLREHFSAELGFVHSLDPSFAVKRFIFYAREAVKPASL